MKVNVNTLFPILLNSGNSFLSYFEKGPVEADPEYLLIVEANNIAAEVVGAHNWLVTDVQNAGAA